MAERVAPPAATPANAAKPPPIVEPVEYFAVRGALPHSGRVNAGQGLTPVCPGAGRVLQGLPDAAKTRLGPLLDRLQGFLAAEDTYAARLTRLTTVRILPAHAASFKALLSERLCVGRGRGPKNTVLRRPAQETRDGRPAGRPVRRRHQRCGPNARSVASAVARARRE